MNVKTAWFHTQLLRTLISLSVNLFQKKSIFLTVYEFLFSSARKSESERQAAAQASVPGLTSQMLTAVRAG